MRQLHEMAVSVRLLESGESDFAAVVVGSFDAARLSEALKKSPETASRTETYQGMTLYVFSQKVAVGGMVDTREEMAFAVLDPQTLALGKPSAVRASIDARGGRAPGIASDSALIEAYNQTGAPAQSVLRFAMRMPEQMIKAELAKDPTNPFVKSLALVRFLSGTVDLASGVALNLTARTASPADAKTVHGSLTGFVNVGKMMVSGNEKLAKYGAALDRIALTVNGSDVRLALDLPMAMVNGLMKAGKGDEGPKPIA
jgi:hypothetical protein